MKYEVKAPIPCPSGHDVCAPSTTWPKEPSPTVECRNTATYPLVPKRYTLERGIEQYSLIQVIQHKSCNLHRY